MAVKQLKCEECGLTVGELQNGSLVIKARHHGEQHTTTWSLATLVAWAHGDGPGKVTLSAEPVTDGKYKGQLLK